MSLHRIRLLLALFLLIPLKLQAQAGAFNLEDWPETAVELKPMYIKAIMEQAGVHKVSFKLPGDFYLTELDKFAAFAAEKHRPYLKTSVAQNLATIAVINCDWNNGVPPLEFAQKFLGEPQMELLKQFNASAVTKLQNNCVN